MRIVLLALASVAVGGALIVGSQLLTRTPQNNRWVVAVGGDSFVVLDERGAPEEVCGVELGETLCHPVQRAVEPRRSPVDRRHVTPSDTDDFTNALSAV